MSRFTVGSVARSASAVLLLVGCDADRPLEPSPGSGRAARASNPGSLTRLPSLGGNSEALAVNAAGTTIVGHSFDRGGMLYAVRWTLQSGSWRVTTLPYSGSARATGVDDQGGAAGYGATPPRRAVLWPAAGGGSSLLDCAGDVGESIASAISAGRQVVAGSGAGVAALWRPGGCRESLPTLGGYSSAATVNGDGTIVGGSASPGATGTSVPVRWREIAGQWQIEQLDGRPGRALGANGAGDLAGVVTGPCALAAGCQRAVVWYAAGGSLDLGTMGAEQGIAYDINSAGEVVGVSTSNGRSTAFVWSASLGTRELTLQGSDAVARAVSDARPDGTRLVVGMAGAQAAVWVVRNP